MRTTETKEIKEAAISERARNKTWHCRLPSEIFLTLATFENKPQELSVDAAAALIAGLKLYTDDKRAKFVEKATYRPSWILRLAAVETGLLTDRRLDLLLTDPAGAVRRAAARQLTDRGVAFDADAVKDFLARGIRPPVVVRLGEDAEEPDAATRRRREKEAKEWKDSGDVIGELRIGSEKTVLRPADFDWAALNFIPPEEHFQGGRNRPGVLA